jgi:hypothetical protein
MVPSGGCREAQELKRSLTPVECDYTRGKHLKKLSHCGGKVLDKRLDGITKKKNYNIEGGRSKDSYRACAFRLALSVEVSIIDI